MTQGTNKDSKFSPSSFFHLAKKARSMHAILQLICALCILEATSLVSGQRRSSGKVLHRRTREPNAQSPIDCKLSRWSEWGPCDPCSNLRFRSRSVEKFGQFRGKRCLESLGDTQSCKTSIACPEEQEIDCGADFRCDSGRCIKKRLVCNVDNDCGDFSDESDCERDPKSPCRDSDIEVSEIGRTAGQGINILGMQPMASPFENEYFNGVCERVRDGNTRTYYRKPWNVAVLNYDTKADKRFTTEFFHDRVTMIKEIFHEKQEHFSVSMSIKQTPTENSQGTSLNASLGYQYSRNESLNYILRYSKERKQTFMHVKGKIQLGRFQMRSRDVRLTDAFLEDLKFLPTEYDKGEYFRFLEMYGTHYAVSGTVGGKYELLYVLDNYAMSLKEVTVEDVKECLGYHLDVSLVNKELDFKGHVKGGKCESINVKSNYTHDDDAVIDDIISLVEGGKIDFSVKIKEMLLRNAKVVDVEDYIQWATSLIDAPVVIQQKPSPIHTLVPVKMKDAHIKKQNLERAIEDYITEYSVCKCEPCKNGGTLLLVDGECMCLCSSYFKGDACQIPKSRADEDKKVTDGGWSCWTAWSQCVQGEHTRTRQCNNPAPGPGGRPCQGDSIEKSYCSQAK
ncbi:complement component C9 [Trachemys scripta elegans]|uniref:complement component C9 n=1 Tax=Trachemys scripta elegans TaxID=31138 RepID=UPI001557BF67|nr:complement component C9 [Trachemys scripta elegans]